MHFLIERECFVDKYNELFKFSPSAPKIGHYLQKKIWHNKYVFFTEIANELKNCNKIFLKYTE